MRTSLTIHEKKHENNHARLSSGRWAWYHITNSFKLDSYLVQWTQLTPNWLLLEFSTQPSIFGLIIVLKLFSFTDISQFLVFYNCCYNVISVSNSSVKSFSSAHEFIPCLWFHGLRCQYDYVLCVLLVLHLYILFNSQCSWVGNNKWRTYVQLQYL